MSRAKRQEAQEQLGFFPDRRSSDRDAEFTPRTVPLVPGVTLIEASAGTGKTYSITTLVLRLLLEPDANGRTRDIGRVLVVTFTNAATDELITRIRARLREAVDVFAGLVRDDDADETLLALRHEHGDAGLARLRSALSGLDRLAVFTIHGFCKRVLEEGALETGTPADAEFLEDERDLLDVALRDWWRRRVVGSRELSQLAVDEGWTYERFLDDFRLWTRYPETRAEPDLPLNVGCIDAARARLAVLWSEGAVAEFLDGCGWLAGSPLADAESRAEAVASVSRWLRGTDDSGRAWIRRCLTSEMLLHPKKGAKKVSRAQVEAWPLRAALDGVADAITQLEQGLRMDCLRALREGLAREKARRQALGFDDLLTKLYDGLVNEGGDRPLAAEIRRHYDAALIDEFQDTDPLQAEIFLRAFEGRPLFFIGDPKQAIYGFRGADIRAYVRAVSVAEPRLTLSENWRSSPAMIASVNALFRDHDRAFLEPGIAFSDATPAARKEPKPDPLAHDTAAGPLTWLLVPPSPEDGKPVEKTAARRRIHREIAREVVRLLQLPGPRTDGRALRAADVAILVRSGFEGREIQLALRKAKVPAIIAGMGDVLDSEEAADLQLVLQAVEEPSDARAVRAALATRLWGCSAADIHRLAQPAHEDEWSRVLGQLADARARWVGQGFMRAVQALLDELRATERVLASEDGERRLTNLRHVLELLHGVAQEERLSPEGLVTWLTRARAEERTGKSERTELRLESDDDAVQIITMHKSKGLEFDVVFCPSLWQSRRASDDESILVHEGDSVVFDHGSTARPQRGALHAAQTLAEDLRLAYVALTRARYRTYVAWGAIEGKSDKAGFRQSALGYLLARPELSPDADVVARMAAAEQKLGDSVATLESLIPDELRAHVRHLGNDGPEPPPLVRTSGAGVEVNARTLRCDALQFTTWQVASFTGLTRGAESHDPRDTSDDDAVPLVRVERDDADIMDFPSGAGPGIALHTLFEDADFAADVAELRTLTQATLERHRLLPRGTEGRVDAIVGMAERVLRGPLPAAGFALRDVPRARTLREWAFDLPLGRVDGHALAAAFADHGGPVARRYAPMLRRLGTREAQGFLTGVVDLAFEHDGRWHIVDWKSNHLGREASAYGQDQLEEAMAGAHYVLQYHLYVTALHRFLRSRVAQYDFDAHMGDVWYAFLRGVDGSGAGWFHDRPSRELIGALDTLCAAGAEAFA